MHFLRIGKTGEIRLLVGVTLTLLVATTIKSFIETQNLFQVAVAVATIILISLLYSKGTALSLPAWRVATIGYVITNILSFSCSLTPFCSFYLSVLGKTLFIFFLIATLYLIQRKVISTRRVSDVFTVTIIATWLLLLLVSTARAVFLSPVNSTLVYLFVIALNIFLFVYAMQVRELSNRLKRATSQVFLSLIFLTAMVELVTFVASGSALSIRLQPAKTPLYVMIVLSGIATFYFLKSQLKPKLEIATPTGRSKWIYWVAIAIICMGFLGFSLFHLGKFMSVDEPKWLNTRVPQLYESIGEGEWEDTYINDKPGVLPALLAGTTNFFIDKADYTPAEFENYLFLWRLPIVIFNCALLFFIALFSRRLLGYKKSLLLTGLIALNPLIIGISQIVNPDSTLWSTGLLAFIVFLLYLRTNGQKYIWLTGIFLGLALISKFPSSILYIVFLLAILWQYFTEGENVSHLFQRIWDLGKVIIISITAYTVLFPATWGNTDILLRGTLGANAIKPARGFLLLLIFILFLDTLILKRRLTKMLVSKLKFVDVLPKVLAIGILAFVFILIVNLFSGYPLFDPQAFRDVFVAREGPFVQTFLFSSYSILLTTTIPILIGLAIYYIYIAIGRKIKDKTSNLFALMATIFIIIFISGVSVKGLIATPRYQILLVPMYASIATIAYLEIFKGKLVKIAIPILLLIAFLVLFSVTPFYLQYTNILNIHDTVMTYAWGFGGYEMSMKLNSLPGAENLRTWVDREGFTNFFVGKVYPRSANPFEESLDIDYLILTSRWEDNFRRQVETDDVSYAYLNIDTPLLEYYDKEPEFEFCLNGNQNNCIKAVKVEKGDLRNYYMQ